MRVDVLDQIAASDPLRVSWRAVRRTDRLGHAPTSAYVEMFWLPLLGPSSVFALRRLCGWLADAPDGLDVSLPLLAGCLGLGRGAGRRAPIVRTLARVFEFGLATIDDDRYRLCREIPMLTPRLLRRLPAELLVAHERWIQGSTRGVTAIPPQRASATGQALPARVALGEERGR